MKNYNRKFSGNATSIDSSEPTVSITIVGHTQCICVCILSFRYLYIRRMSTFTVEKRMTILTYLFQKFPMPACARRSPPYVFYEALRLSS